MSRKKVGVLRGGPSSEHEVSLKTGKTVIDALSDKHDVFDIYIDKEGAWHYSGLPITPEKLFKKVDVIFNAMHGAYGEDGTVQKILDQFGIPYTGSTALSSAVGMNKILSKKVYQSHGLKTPIHTTVSRKHDIEKEAIRIFKTFPIPAVIKPANGGSSVGTSIAKTLKELVTGLEDALKYSDTALIEEFISGREATCGVVDNFRGEKHYSLLPNEIGKSKESEFYDYKAKYISDTQEIICPGNFPETDKKLIQEMSVMAHKALGLRHYSRSDFIIHPKRGIYILETNTLPGLTDHSHMPRSMQAIGCSLSDFFEHLINLALKSK